ncbi:MAG: response regulator [Chloroflexi bacterium]|nr:response regulator [Chloroflexota bacterium]
MVAGSISNPSATEFEQLVRDALLHLYDAAYLQTHPLAQLVDAPPGNSAVLRGKVLLQTLLDTIDSLHPAPATPTDSRAWRSYRLLELRYIEGLTAGEVVVQLAISKTQYQRDHARALDAVASLLRDRWQIRERRAPEQPSPSVTRATIRLTAGPPLADAPGLGPHPSPLPQGEGGAFSHGERAGVRDVPPDPESRESLALAETERLAAQMNPDYVDLTSALTDLVALLQRMSQENRTTVSLQARPNLPPIYGDRVALRQILLGLLNTALERGAGGRLDVSLDLIGRGIAVALSASAADVMSSTDQAGRAGLEVEVARRLVVALGGTLEVESPDRPGSWSARVVLPVAPCPTILVMDNQPDFIGLVARYLAEHGWEVVGAPDVRQAESLALGLRPTVILVDVMMPGQDGWDLLLALKARPETRCIPVIVCSVLYEPQVARALGAVAYLAKPISQAALLGALAPYRPGSRQPSAISLPSGGRDEREPQMNADEHRAGH